jgi:hypothetical protein
VILMRIMPPVPVPRGMGVGTGGTGRAAALRQSPPQRPCVASRANSPRVKRRAVPMRSVSGTRLLFQANLLRFPAIRSFRGHSRGERRTMMRSGWQETPRPRGQTRGLTSAHWQGAGSDARLGLNLTPRRLFRARTPQRCPPAALTRRWPVGAAGALLAVLGPMRSLPLMNVVSG